MDIGRDFIVSPSGSAISRPPLPLDASRPVVRLPPQSRPEQQMPVIDGVVAEQPPDGMQSTINDIPQPQTHPLPQKPIHQENHAYASVPMQQPRPQKTLSVADIEPPTLHQTLSQPYQQAFHQQVPVQVSNGLGQDAHARHSSYASQHSTGTPLSQIPERAIHAAPFQPQPAQYPQQPYYPPYQMNLAPQGYYYPQPNYPSTVAPSAAAPAFVPGVQQGQPQSEPPASQPSGQTQSGSNLVAQEINGMVYYFDASQIQPMTNYPPYPAPQNFPMAGNMNGMATPNQEGYYYPPPAPGVVYYPQ
ncbi:hypothetical protein SLS62_007179 [Diatrype stigma]|uniref:Uncharacterized protein n=1 Tax=Diatrype stigma TaxID=117547 RepID=A0AAN9UPS0_9PEZI